MSPIRLGTFTVALIVSAVLGVVWILEAAANEDLVARPIEQLLRILTLLAWHCLIAVVCTETAMRRGEASTAALQASLAVAAEANMALLRAAIAKAVEEAGDTRATNARLELLERLGSQRGGRGRGQLDLVDT